MKKLKILSFIILFTIGMFSCKNEDWSFPDFDYTTSYFPYQYPVRTIVLGDYNYDNSGDKEGKFIISATMGGVYKNNEDRVVNFAIDETLTHNLYSTPGNTPIIPLPSNYYTLSDNSKIVIRKGELSGGVEVQLSEAFFADPLAVGINYVIPLRITGASTDSVLVGSSDMPNPDPRIASNWILAPKNFTLFAVKYVNDYHGKYLLRGKSVVKDAAGTAVETLIYRKPEIVKDDVVSVLTSSKNIATYENSVRLTTGSPGKFQMQMTFGSDGNCVISNTDKYPFTISGTGKYVKDGDEWGDKKRNTLYLNYQINDGTYTHTITDTLVFRDKAIAFEQFNPSVKVN